MFDLMHGVTMYILALDGCKRHRGALSSVSTLALLLPTVQLRDSLAGGSSRPSHSGELYCVTVSSHGLPVQLVGAVFAVSYTCGLLYSAMGLVNARGSLQISSTR